MSKAFLSKKPTANFLKVNLPNNVKSVGAKVMVKRSDGKTLHQRWVIGEGLCSDSSHTLIFGLGENKVENVRVEYLDGRTDREDNVSENSTVRFG